MLYIISDEMIPDTHSHGYEKGATYSLLFGFVLMLFIDTYISNDPAKEPLKSLQVDKISSTI